MKLLAITVTLALTVPVLPHDGHHPAIAKLSNLIGGVWSTKMPDGSAIRVTYKWMADGHTILGEGTWTMGRSCTPRPSSGWMKKPRSPSTSTLTPAIRSTAM